MRRSNLTRIDRGLSAIRREPGRELASGSGLTIQDHTDIARAAIDSVRGDLSLRAAYDGTPAVSAESRPAAAVAAIAARAEHSARLVPKSPRTLARSVPGRHGREAPERRPGCPQHGRPGETPERRPGRGRHGCPREPPEFGLRRLHRGTRTLLRRRGPRQPLFSPCAVS